jgi:hypothetical protein
VLVVEGAEPELGLGVAREHAHQPCLKFDAPFRMKRMSDTFDVSNCRGWSNVVAPANIPFIVVTLVYQTLGRL